MEDADRLTIGMWIDYVIEWNNARIRNREEADEDGKPVRRRRATQADFDNF